MRIPRNKQAIQRRAEKIRYARAQTNFDTVVQEEDESDYTAEEVTTTQQEFSLNGLYHSFLEQYPRATVGLTLLIWLLFLLWAFSIGFFTVIFMATIFIALYLSLGKKKKGEVSAYSVFNPGCKRLLGQITPEHFERDIMRTRI